MRGRKREGGRERERKEERVSENVPRPSGREGRGRGREDNKVCL